VSGQVTDSAGQTWNNGTILFRFVPIPNYPGPYTWTGGAFDPNTTHSGTMNATGAYSGVSVPGNDQITPTGTSWQVVVTPQATAPSFLASAIVSGATQTLNITPDPIRVAPGANNAVYATSEVVGPIIGSQIYVIGTGFSTYDGSTWTAVGGGTAATLTIAHGTAALGTAPIASNSAATVVTVSATGVLTTDDIIADFNADPTAITGYIPGTMLTIVKYPTADHVNFKVVNNTAGSITPGAVTLNWRVVR